MIRAPLIRVVAAVLLALSGASGTARAAPPTARQGYDRSFWNAWSDGKAEVSTYALHRTRYGEPREGTVVVIVVSEPWSKSKMVKDDAAAGADRLPVLKLHTTTAFSTGIYDYHLSTSAFVNLEPLNKSAPGSVIKVAFSAQEWCGQVYHEYVDDGRESSELVRSYFANESMSRAFSRDEGPLLVEDALLLWARGLAGPPLPPASSSSGSSSTVRWQPSLERSRLDHKPVERSTATLTHVAPGANGASGVTDVGGVKVPSDRWRVQSGERVIDVVVERGGARRVLRVEGNDGTTLTYVKSARLPYWQLNHTGDVDERRALGLPASLPSPKEP